MPYNITFGKLDAFVWSVMAKPISWLSHRHGSFRVAHGLAWVAVAIGAFNPVGLLGSTIAIGQIYFGFRRFERACRDWDGDSLPTGVYRLAKDLSIWRRLWPSCTLLWLLSGLMASSPTRALHGLSAVSWMLLVAACYAETHLQPKTKTRAKIRARFRAARLAPIG